MKNYCPTALLYGGYYVLQNVQVKQGQPEFLDIWILVQSIKDTKVQKSVMDL